MGNNSQHYIDAWMVSSKDDALGKTIVFSEEIAKAAKEGLVDVFDSVGLPVPEISICKVQVDIRFPL